MKRQLITTAVLSVLYSFAAIPTHAFTIEEHQKVAIEAIDIVAPECDGIVPAADAILINDRTFPELCAEWANNDRSFARFHIKGESILEQLDRLTASELQRKFDFALSYGSQIADLEERSGGVVVNYLIYHQIAMRFAVLASENPVRDRAMVDRFLAYEARAQGYLVDAFSSAHMLMPSSGILNAVLSANLNHVHNHYRDEGLYVIDSRGNSWRTFGDGLMHYYPATHNHVLEACATSLREVCLVYAVNRDAVPAKLADWAENVCGPTYQADVNAWANTGSGRFYYETARMPTLLTLPMVGSATWSVPGEQVDSLGISERIHYPQLSDSGLHDPTLEKQLVDYLYSADNVGSWMRLDLLSEKTAADIVKFDKDVASVRFVQDRDILPAFRGMLTTHSLTGVLNDRGNGWGATFGFGWGIVDNLMLLQNLSAEVRFAPGFDEPERFLLMLDLGATVDLNVLSVPMLNLDLPRSISHFRFDIAYVEGVRKRYQSSGARLFGGFELPRIRAPWVYMGVATRVGYQITILERTMHGLTVEFAFH